MNSKNISCVFVLSLFLIIQLSTGLIPKPGFAQNLDNITIELENVVAGLSSPISIKNVGDGSENLFIVEQDGRVRIYDGTQLLPNAFLDINTLVLSGGERGLLDIEFHPDYAANGFFYVNYTNLAGSTVVARYTRSAANPLLADPGSAAILLTVSQPASNHNGGQMQFGPDGFLYIALGDGGVSGMSPANPAQDLSQLLGKVLRIDVDGGSPYAIPADNPFVGVAGTRAEIWAYGLRNPWRMSFDRATGDLLIADVGQNSFEEVNFQPAASAGGENYGWPLMEGTSCFNPSSNCNDGSLTLPILEYDHSGGNCSVTGGYRYRGSMFPQMNGVYFYGDFCTGQIWGAEADSTGNWSSKLLLDAFNFGLTTFGEDDNGEVYLVNRGSGTLFRINQINIPADSNDVVMNLTSGVTVFFNDNSSSSVLHADMAEAIAIADVDNNGEDDVIVSFPSGAGPGGTGGTYISRNQGVLVLLDSKTAMQIAAGDLDGNGQRDLLLDFGAEGLWSHLNDANTFLLIDLPLTAMAAGDLDNNGMDDMVLSFEGVGTFSLLNFFSDLTFYDPGAAQMLSMADTDGNGEDDVVASFPAGTGPDGTGGTYIAKNQGVLTLLDSKTAEQVAVGDIDGNGQEDLLLNFGADNFWLAVNDTNPFLFIDLPLTALAAGDLDNNGQDDMVLSFPGIATAVIKNLASFDVLDPEVALHLATGNVDGN